MLNVVRRCGFLHCQRRQSGNLKRELVDFLVVLSQEYPPTVDHSVVSLIREHSGRLHSAVHDHPPGSVVPAYIRRRVAVERKHDAIYVCLQHVQWNLGLECKIVVRIYGHIRKRNADGRPGDVFLLMDGNQVIVPCEIGQGRDDDPAAGIAVARIKAPVGWRLYQLRLLLVVFGFRSVDDLHLDLQSGQGIAEIRHRPILYKDVRHPAPCRRIRSAEFGLNRRVRHLCCRPSIEGQAAARLCAGEYRPET